jgi:hypothetical protein
MISPKTRHVVLTLLVVGCGTGPAEPDPMLDEPETTDTGSAQTSSTSADEPEPEPESSSEGTTEAPGETSDETGEGWVPYQACGERNECPEEADECHVYVAHVPVRYCTVHCEDDSDCPAPSSGQAVPRCDPYLMHSYCALDCESAFCPSGMGCWDVTLVDDTEVKRCGWVDE